MMKERQLIFPKSQWEAVTSHLSCQSDQEHAALAFANRSESPDRSKLLVDEIQPLPSEELEEQTSGHVIPSTKAIRTAVEKAVESSRALILLHTHLWHGANHFSATDIATIEHNFLWGWENFKLLQAAVVINRTEGKVDALVWSPTEQVVVPIDELHVAGYPYCIYIPAAAEKRLRILDDLALQQAIPRPASATLGALADRQTRAFGLPLQRTLSQLRVGIVGLSGTGSQMTEALVRNGAEDFVLCDPQLIELENLGRIIGATYEDVQNHQPKVAIAERTIKAIRPWAKVEALRCSVFAPEAIQLLKAVDILFGCTDNHSSRLLLNKLSRQYQLLYVDVGSGIFVTQDGEDQKITHMGGQVHLMLPDTPCLTCRGAVDRTAAAEELLDEDQRAVYRQRGYVIGDEITQPQVVQLNGLIVNLAVTEFINLFTAFKESQPYLVYDALKPGILAIAVKTAPGCLHCSVAGSGDAEPVWGSTPHPLPLREATPVTHPLHNGNTPIHPSVPDQDAGIITAEHTPAVSSNETPKHRLWRLRPGGMSKWVNPFRTTPT
jgi:molybdopterin-synthase adenylyltransferase